MKAVVEKAPDGGFGIYCDDIEGAIGFGDTEALAKADFLETLQEQAEYYKERRGVFPSWYSIPFDIEYLYDDTFSEVTEIDLVTC